MTMDLDNLPEDAVDLKIALANAAVTTKKPGSYEPRGPVEIELLDGRIVRMEPPKMALSQFIAGCLADVSFKDTMMMQQEKLNVKSLLYITEIDGKSISKISSPVARLALEQELGDENLDAILIQFIDNFPPVDASTLKVVKKS